MNVDQEKKETILIVGDWFYDEHLFLSSHHSEVGSYTGKFHFRIPDKQATIQTANMGGCGILLKQFMHYQDLKKYYFVGVGLWNTADDELVHCLLCPFGETNKFLNPFLIRDFPKYEIMPKKKYDCPYSKGKNCHENFLLINLADHGAKTGNTEAPTNRVRRYYEGLPGESPSLLAQLDAECSNEANIPRVYEKLEGLKDRKIAAVVLLDYGRNVLNKKLVEVLSKYIDKKARIFVRSKFGNADWILTLSKKFKWLELIVLDHRVAARMMGDNVRWLYGKNLSKGALKLLVGLTITTKGKPRKFKKAAVLLDDNSVIAADGEFCFSITDSLGDRQPINISRTTTFFAALIAQILTYGKAASYYAQCLQARSCSYEWTRSIVSRNKNAEHWVSFSQLLSDALSTIKKNPESLLPVKTKYAELSKEWADALAGNGQITIKINHKKIYKLQLWRSESMLPGYVCIGEAKRRQFDQLVCKIKDFVESQHEKDQLSCLITASPGWGKSYFADCLSTCLGVQRLAYSVAQMSTTDDFVECLAEIASVQTRKKERLLIFMDEINATIQGNFVTQLLLGPLYGGEFRYHNMRFKLRPAAWIFASSTRIQNIEGDLKRSDFVTRLNSQIIDLDRLNFGPENIVKAKKLRNRINNLIGAKLEEYNEFYRKLSTIDFKKYGGLLHSWDKNKKTKAKKIPPVFNEQVYLMTRFLMDRSDDRINQIQKCVLDYFSNIFPVNGIRSLQLLASHFGRPVDGKILASSVPDIQKHEELRRHVLVPYTWWSRRDKILKENKEAAENDFVEIEEHPK